MNTTANPGDLGTVDGKVGGDRAVPTLLDEDLVGVRGVGGGSSLSIQLLAPLTKAFPEDDRVRLHWCLSKYRMTSRDRDMT